MAIAGFALLVAGSALASHAPLPAFVGVPQEAQPSPNQVTYEMYGEAEFYPASSAHAVVQRGKHWHANMRLSGMPKGAKGKDVWARMKPAFLSSGWSVAAEYDQNPFSATLHLQKNGIDAWANIGIFGADDMRMDVVETGQPPTLPPFAPPAATPERINPAHGDFPYLPPLPGSKFQSGQQTTAPMTIKLPGYTHPEIVATATIVKNYVAPDGLSSLLFATAYHDALTTAGWTVPVLSQGIHQSDAQLAVHYGKNGRDIWAVLHGTPGGYSIAVADAGAKDLGNELAMTCHVALYGVLFDFDKATLKPESDAVLGRMQAMLQKDAALKVEVQGHTDAVGGDAYNLTLSDARAHSVVAWLTQHGIAADRLT
ncbi:MAG: OmpA family protein, partial [Nevskiales bacterium]